MNDVQWAVNECGGDTTMSSVDETDSVSKPLQGGNVPYHVSIDSEGRKPLVSLFVVLFTSKQDLVHHSHALHQLTTLAYKGDLEQHNKPGIC
jgi:hypothetical protein